MSKTSEKDQFIIKAGVLEIKKQITVKLLIFLLLFVWGFYGWWKILTIHHLSQHTWSKHESILILFSTLLKS